MACSPDIDVVTSPGRRASLGLRLGVASLGLVLVAACSTVFDGELGEVGCERLGAYGPPDCPEGQTCVSGACADVGVPLGHECGADAACSEPWRCLAPADVGESGPARCSAPCCSSFDCGPIERGQVCWSPPGLGGSLCWPAADVGRAAIGGGRMGDACGGGGDCRSGLCEGGRCVDGCCDGSYCPADELCRVKNTELADGDAWTCGKPPTSLPPVETCDTPDDCSTAKCRRPLATDIGVCAQPCCSSEDCGSVIVQGMKRPVACTLVEGGLRACGKLVDTAATGQVGSACVSDADCRSGWCAGDGSPGSYCTDLCCDDASCGDVSAFSCIPRPFKDSWVLRCVRK